ncbi:MAG: DUF6763 family protein [Methylococcales bacterium]
MEVNPIVGNWYQRLDEGKEFEVVAFDEEEGIVEIQHTDGKFEEIDIDAWYGLELENIENPDEYSEDLDEGDLEEIEYEDSEDLDEEDWDEP